MKKNQVCLYDDGGVKKCLSFNESQKYKSLKSPIKMPFRIELLFFVFIFGYIVYGSFDGSLKSIGFALLVIIIFVIYMIPIFGFIAITWKSQMYQWLLNVTHLNATWLTDVLFYSYMIIGLVLCALFTIWIISIIKQI